MAATMRCVAATLLRPAGLRTAGLRGWGALRLLAAPPRWQCDAGARWLSSSSAGAVTVEEVKQMQAAVASLVAQRHWDDAFDAAVECSQAIKDLTGARHPGYASALNNLALIQKSRGELDAAATLYEEALGVYTLVYGDLHPSCAMAMHNTCLLYKIQGKQEEALKLCEQALAARRKIYQGDQHSDIAVSMYTMGAILMDSQEYSKAETWIRDAVSLLEMVGDGKLSLLQCTAQNNLALCLKSKGSYEEAETLYRDVVRIRAERLGAEHQDTMTAMHNLAELYRAIGDESAAHEIQEELQKAVAKHRAKHGNTNKGESLPTEGDGKTESWKPSS